MCEKAAAAEHTVRYPVRWQWKQTWAGHDWWVRWVDYSDHQARRLEEAFKRGEGEVETSHMDGEKGAWTICFKTWVQENPLTGRKRPVRRCLVTTPEATPPARYIQPWKKDIVQSIASTGTGVQTATEKASTPA